MKSADDTTSKPFTIRFRTMKWRCLSDRSSGSRIVSTEPCLPRQVNLPSGIQLPGSGPANPRIQRRERHGFSPCSGMSCKTGFNLFPDRLPSIITRGVFEGHREWGLQFPDAFAFGIAGAAPEFLAGVFAGLGLPPMHGFAAGGTLRGTLLFGPGIGAG